MFKPQTSIDYPMIEKINNQFDVIENAIAWANSNLEGQRAEETYNNLVKARRQIKKKKYAIESNSAAAIYGESQVGKSYLVSSLLSQNGSPFSITDHEGVTHHFIEKINPPGNESESTSLVTRFSVNYKPINDKFPIKAVLFSTTDLILTLCDSFYSDVVFGGAQSFKWLSEAEINAHIATLFEKAENRKSIQTTLGEDDVLDIADYFRKLENTERIIDCDYFKKISRVVDKFSPSEWPNVFSILWNNNEYFTGLFNVLLKELENLNFEPEIFLPIEAVLYKHGTLLDVKRLHELYSEPDKTEPDFDESTKFILKENSTPSVIKKNILCAISTELVFSQPQSLTQEKPFLIQTDLLDFPGARGRMKKSIDIIDTLDMPQFFLRGKVSYLFKKYSDSEKLNILLFCAKHSMSAQREMPRILNGWIAQNIGESASNREVFIKQSQISPLFIIGTWFNVNLAYNPQLDKRDGSGTPLHERWRARFELSLEKELIESNSEHWFNNWTETKKYFQNIYLLRDFEKSETPSNLFKGFHDNKKEIEIVPTPQYPDFRKDLKQSFLDFEFIKKHFDNPEKSWDAAAEINNDGTELIIQNLSITAFNIDKARKQKIETELETISKQIFSELSKHYRSNDKDQEIENAKSHAGHIQWLLDRAFNGDKMKDFGFLMRDLTISESQVLEKFKDIINSADHRETVHSDKFSTYRMQVPPITGDTEISYFNRLCEHYEKNSPESKEIFRKTLDEDGINLNELLASNSETLIKNHSQQLADEIVDYWGECLRKENKSNVKRILGKDTSLENLIDMYNKLFIKVNLSKRIAQSIRHHIDGRGKAGIPLEIIADISSQILNQCVLNVGFDNLDDGEIHDLKEANEKNKLNLSFFNDAKPRENSVQELFEKIENQIEIIQKKPDEMKALPNFRNFLLWRDRIKIGFVSVCNIPNYDVAANQHLNSIMNELKFS
jgi:hypothetical protein